MDINAIKDSVMAAALDTRTLRRTRVIANARFQCATVRPFAQIFSRMSIAPHCRRAESDGMAHLLPMYQPRSALSVQFHPVGSTT
jgi:hypothetical protein